MARDCTLGSVSVAVPLHPDLGLLSRLIGEWEGEGRGRWKGPDFFHYREWVRFAHNGKPFLAYTQRTAAQDDGRPLHAESGYWRAITGGTVELVLAHPIGVAEIAVGRWNGHQLALRGTSLRTTPAAKRVTLLERDFELAGDKFRYELRMSTDEGPARWHLSGELRRTA
jgi:hypothetical protein